MLALQYDLFEENTEICLLRQEIAAIKKSSDSVRKGLFAKQSEMMKIVIRQQAQIDLLKEMLMGKRK